MLRNTAVAPAALHHKLRLAGQILLYGSLGTASSAVVYLLQDQFRQIRRLKGMMDNGKRLPDLARKYGFVEVTIRSPSDSPQPNDGRVVFLLPRDASSDISLSRKRKRRSESEESRLEGRQLQHRSIPSAPTQGRPRLDVGHEFSVSGHHSSSLHARIRANRGKVTKPSNRSFLHSMVSSISAAEPSIDRLQLRCEHYLRRHKFVSSSSIDTFGDLVSLMATLDPKTLKWKEALPLLKESIVQGRVDIADVVAAMHSEGSYRLLLHFYRSWNQNTTWRPDTYRLILNTALVLAVRDQLEPGLMHRLIRDAPHYISTPDLVVLLRHLSDTSEMTTSFADLILSRFLCFASEDNSIDQEWLDDAARVCAESFYESEISHTMVILSGQLGPLSSSAFLRLSTAISAAVGSSRECICNLILLGDIWQCPFGVVRFCQTQPLQLNPGMLGQENASRVYNAYESISTNSSLKIPLENMVLFLRSESSNVSQADAVSLIQKYFSLRHLGQDDRARLLQLAYENFDHGFLSVLLSSMPILDGNVVKEMQALQLDLLRRIAADSNDFGKVQESYVSIERWHTRNALEMPSDIKRTIFPADIIKDRHPEKPRANLTTNGSDASPTWYRALEVMLFHGQRNDWGEVESLLTKLEESNSIPSSQRERSKLGLTFRLRAKKDYSLASLRFIQTWATKLDIPVDERTYDYIVYANVHSQSYGECLSALEEFQAFCSSQQTEMGVRPYTILWAFRALKQRSACTGPFLLAMFKKVLLFDERLVSKNLCAVVIEKLSVSAKKALKLAMLRPRVGVKNGAGVMHTTHVSPAIFKEHMMKKLHARVQYVQEVANRVGWLSESLQEKPGSDIPTIALGKFSTRTSEQMSAYASRMHHALATGKESAVIQNCESMRSAGLPLPEKVLDVAVAAYLKSDNVQKAEEIASEAEAAGVSASGARFILLRHRIAVSNMSDAELGNIVTGWYKSGLAKTPRQAHGILIAAVARLMSEGTSGSVPAINLLADVYNSKWRERYPFDIYVFNIFLRAYGQVHNLKGILWVVKTVLKQHFPINPTFAVTLRRALRRIWRNLAWKGDREASESARILCSQIESICRAKYFMDKRRMFTFGRAVIHKLLYDAPHPFPRLQGSISLQPRQGHLDTRHHSKSRESNMIHLGRRRSALSGKLLETRRYRRKVWLERGEVSPKHPRSLQLLGTEWRAAAKDLATSVSPRLTAHLYGNDEVDIEIPTKWVNEFVIPESSLPVRPRVEREEMDLEEF